MSLEQLSCEICYMNYDNLTHLPKILPRCGHTLCNSCVKEIIKESNNVSNSITCPKCKCVSAAKLTPNKKEHDFPTNCNLLAVIGKMKGTTNCIHGSGCPLHICLNSDCEYKTAFCLEDVGKEHPKCKKELIIRMDKFDCLTYLSNKKKEETDFSVIRETVKNKIDELRDKLLNVIDLAAQCVESYSLPSDKISQTQFLSNHQSYDTAFEPDDGKIAITKKRNNQIVRFYQDMQFCLTKTLSVNLERCVNSNLSFAIKSLLNIIDVENVDNSKLLKEIQNTSFAMREHVILRDFRLEKYDSVENYFQKLAVHFDKNEDSIYEFSYSNFSKKDTSVILNSVRSNWNESPLENDFANVIAKDFELKSEDAKKSTLVTVVSKNEFPVKNPNNKGKHFFFSKDQYFIRCMEVERVERKSTFCEIN